MSRRSEVRDQDGVPDIRWITSSCHSSSLDLLPLPPMFWAITPKVRRVCRSNACTAEFASRRSIPVSGEERRPRRAVSSRRCEWDRVLGGGVQHRGARSARRQDHYGGARRPGRLGVHRPGEKTRNNILNWPFVCLFNLLLATLGAEQSLTTETRRSSLRQLPSDSAPLGSRTCSSELSVCSTS